MAIIPNSTNIVITLKFFRFKYPKNIGLEVEAIVPIADTIPAPSPLALEGYSSQTYIWKKQKKKEMQSLKMKISTNSIMLYAHKSQI